MLHVVLVICLHRKLFRRQHFLIPEGELNKLCRNKFVFNYLYNSFSVAFFFMCVWIKAQGCVELRTNYTFIDLSFHLWIARARLFRFSAHNSSPFLSPYQLSHPLFPFWTTPRVSDLEPLFVSST